MTTSPLGRATPRRVLVCLGALVVASGILPRAALGLQPELLAIWAFESRAESTLITCGTDPWGSPYRRALGGRSGVFVYSLGPNKADEQGHGDDIVVGPNVSLSAADRLLVNLAHSAPLCSMLAVGAGLWAWWLGGRTSASKARLVAALSFGLLVLHPTSTLVEPILELAPHWGAMLLYRSPHFVQLSLMIIAAALFWVACKSVACASDGNVHTE